MHRATPNRQPDMASRSIRQAGLADLPSLVAIEERAFLTDRMSPRSFHHLVTRARADCLVATIDGRPLGYVAVFYRCNARVARLHSLAIDPTVRRGGLGRALLNASEAAARDRGASILRLAVRHDNHTAARLYSNSGYREIGTEHGYYADGMAAFTMEKHIAPG